MAVPSQLSKLLRGSLGEDAGGDLVSWLDEMRLDHDKSRAEMAALIQALARRVDEGFAKVDVGFAKVDDGFAKIDARFATAEDRFATVDDRFAKVDERLADLKVTIADVKADLMKWMLVFWVGAVGAIAALAGVLRQ